MGKVVLVGIDISKDDTHACVKESVDKWRFQDKGHWQVPQ
jgi:hypothetical protein